MSPLGAHFSSPSQLYSEKVCRRLVYHEARDTTGRSQAVPGEVPKISSFFGFFGMKLVEEIAKKSISWLRHHFMLLVTPISLLTAHRYTTFVIVSESEPGSEVRVIARLWTGLAASRLDAERKRHVIDFLRVSHLIEADNIIDIRGVQLDGADLRETSMRGLNLRGVNLSEADLRDADVEEANLSRANLNNADLSYANLTKAKVKLEQLAKAKSLKGATMPDGSIHP